jgi:hypothetical protein
MNNHFAMTAGARPERSYFELYEQHTTTSGFGMLIPMHFEECIPGDFHKLSVEMLIKTQPIDHPVMGEINCYVHTFHVPYRILWDDFEKFYTGGREGEFLPDADKQLYEPKWSNPTILPTASRQDLYLWDKLGLPMRPRTTSPGSDFIPVIPTPGTDHLPSLQPNDYIRRAYNMIYNEYYRDPNLQDEVALDNELILFRNWEKDYFTSALNFQQRGTAPAAPIELIGQLTADEEKYLTQEIALSMGPVNMTPQRNGWVPQHPDRQNFATAGLYANTSPIQDNNPNRHTQIGSSITASIDPGNTLASAGGNLVNILTGQVIENAYNPAGNLLTTHVHKTNQSIIEWLNENNTIELTGATFNVSDLRRMVQVQRWMEQSARGGPRFKEALKAHYGTDLPDYTAQRPEYLGGAKFNVFIGEVFQTSNPGTATQTNALGARSGHATEHDYQFIGDHKAKEPGIIVSIMSIMPKPTYSSQGMPRQLLKENLFDYPFPVYTNLSERAVLRGELCMLPQGGANVTVGGKTYTPQEWNSDIHGFQGIYDEYRTKQNKVTGLMRTPAMSPWHLSRTFLLTAPPTLSAEFVMCGFNGMQANAMQNLPENRIFAVPSEPGFLITAAFTNDCTRPLPIMAQPGLIDHN